MAQHHASGMTEADMIRWVGVAVAVVGTLLAAPSGTALVRDRIVRAVRRVGIGIRRVILNVGGKILKPLLSAVFRLILFSAETGRVPGESALSLLTNLLASMQQKYDKEIEALTAANQAITERIYAQERRAAFAGARGAVLMGIGIVLTGVPDGLARFAVIGWLVVVGVGVLTLLLLHDAMTRR